jgi:hypothetical protein
MNCFQLRRWWNELELFSHRASDISPLEVSRIERWQRITSVAKETMSAQVHVPVEERVGSHAHGYDLARRSPSLYV